MEETAETGRTVRFSSRGFLSGVLFGFAVTVVTMLVLTLIRPLPAHLPGVGRVEIISQQTSSDPAEPAEPVEATEDAEVETATSGDQPTPQSTTVAPPAAPDQSAQTSGSTVITTTTLPPVTGSGGEAAAETEPEATPESSREDSESEAATAESTSDSGDAPDTGSTSAAETEQAATVTAEDGEASAEVEAESGPADAPAQTAEGEPDATPAEQDSETAAETETGGVQQIARTEPENAEGLDLSRPAPPPISLPGKALEVNARAFDVPENAPLLAVVLTDPANGSVEPEALDLLTMPLTLAIRPTGPSAEALARRARAAKHEVLAELPMDTGASAALTADLDADAIRYRTQAYLALMDDAVGVISPDDAQMIRDKTAMEPVLTLLGTHGFAYVEAKRGAGGTAGPLAGEAGVSYVEANRSVPADATEQQVFDALENAAFTARQSGTAIIRVPASTAALTAMLRWGLVSDGRPVWFAPVSAVIQKRTAKR